MKIQPTIKTFTIPLNKKTTYIPSVNDLYFDQNDGTWAVNNVHKEDKTGCLIDRQDERDIYIVEFSERGAHAIPTELRELDIKINQTIGSVNFKGRIGMNHQRTTYSGFGSFITSKETKSWLVRELYGDDVQIMVGPVVKNFNDFTRADIIEVIRAPRNVLINSVIDMLQEIGLKL